MARNITRIKKSLQVLLKRIENEDIAIRDLKNALSTEQYREFQDSWLNEKEFRADMSAKPAPIKQYEELLKRALFLNNRAENLSNRKRASAQKMWHEAEAAFEKTIEHLQELLEADYSMQIWFDREINFDPEFAPKPCATDMPRIKTSRSSDNLSLGMTKNSKRNLKRSAIENALKQILLEEENFAKGITQTQHKQALQESAKVKMERAQRLLQKLK